VLVTGGAGFVGTTLVRRQVASGYLVRLLDNLAVVRVRGLPRLTAFTN
jgi:nucleoside-diphosphate-sugar epimerase